MRRKANSLFSRVAMTLLLSVLTATAGWAQNFISGTIEVQINTENNANGTVSITYTNSSGETVSENFISSGFTVTSKNIYSYTLTVTPLMAES